MKYDTLSFQTNFPLNCPRRENLVNLLEEGEEVVRLAREGGRGAAGREPNFGNSEEAADFCVWASEHRPG